MDSRNLLLVSILLMSACEMTGHGKASKPRFKTYTRNHPVVPEPPRFVEHPLAFDLVTTELRERYTVVSKEGWYVYLEVAVSNQGADPATVSREIAIDSAGAECTPSTLHQTDMREAGWLPHDTSAVLRPGGVAKMWSSVSCKHAEKLGDPFVVSVGWTRVAMRRR